MTSNKRTVNTILSTCLKPFYEVRSDRARIEQLKDRLDEVTRIAEMRVFENARLVLAEGD